MPETISRWFPVHGRFTFPPAGLCAAVLQALQQPSQATYRSRSALVNVVRQWQRDQPEQFAELAALVMNAPRKTVVQVAA